MRAVVGTLTNSYTALFLTEENYKGLEESIKKEGCRDPLVLWGDILVDGHNRYKICTENSIHYQTVQREFKDRNEVVIWIISNQMGRRNLTALQKSELALMLKPRIAEQAKERMDAGNNQYSPSNKSDEGNTRTDEKLGKIAGVSKKTVMDKLPEPKKPVREELGKGEVISKGCE